MNFLLVQEFYILNKEIQFEIYFKLSCYLDNKEIKKKVKRVSKKNATRINSTELMFVIPFPNP